tara:strand:+ start:1768 stop:2241 length:474 start_codon:yes stop_codon:yes gene_type:complete
MMITLKEALANITLANEVQKVSDTQKELDKCLEVLKETNAYKAWAAAQDAVHDSEEMAALAKAKEVKDEIAQGYKDSAITYSQRKFKDYVTVRNAGKRTSPTTGEKYFFHAWPVTWTMRANVEPYDPSKHDKKIASLLADQKEQRILEDAKRNQREA